MSVRTRIAVMLAENAESHGGLRHDEVASVFPCLCRIVILDIPSVHSNAEYSDLGSLGVFHRIGYESGHGAGGLRI